MLSGYGAGGQRVQFTWASGEPYRLTRRCSRRSRHKNGTTEMKRKKSKGNSDTAVKVAIIGLVGTVVAAVLASPVLLPVIERAISGFRDEPALLSDPPEFVTDYIYEASEIERLEFEYEDGRLPPEATQDLISISQVAFSGQGQLFHVLATVSNTTSKPLVVTVDSKYFSLVDDRGNSARLVYFCCSAQGEVLGIGQQRTIELFFESQGWYGKEVRARDIFFRVRGFLPLIRASWRFPVLATAD